MRPVWRHILPSRGIRELYPDPHARGIGVPKNHVHSLAWPEDGDQQHVPWHLTREGSELLWRRLEQLECYYALLPALFHENGPGRDWHNQLSAPELVGFTPLRHGGLVEAWVRYSGSISLLISWVGKSLPFSTMREKFDNRLEDLDVRTAAEHIERRRRRAAGLPPPDPGDFPPIRPSGYVVFGADKLAFKRAFEHLGYNGKDDEQPFMFLQLEGATAVDSILLQRVKPSLDRVADYFKTPVVGRPQDLAPPGTPRDPLNGVTENRIIDLLTEFSGKTQAQLSKLLPDSAEPMAVILERLVANQYLTDRRGMYYLHGAGTLYVTRRDRYSLQQLRRRISHDIWSDHDRVGPRLYHTRGLNDVVTALRLAGIEVHAGHRHSLHFPNFPTPMPDAVMEVTSPLGGGDHYIEYERTADDLSTILAKLEPWEILADHGARLRVAFICETKEAEEIFAELTGGLALLTTTLGEVKSGPLTGEETVWRHGGRSISVYPFEW